MERIFDGVSIFTTNMENGNIIVVEWDIGYQNSEWFGFVYYFLKKKEKFKPNIIQKTFKYKIDIITNFM